MKYNLIKTIKHNSRHMLISLGYGCIIASMILIILNPNSIQKEEIKTEENKTLLESSKEIRDITKGMEITNFAMTIEQKYKDGEREDYEKRFAEYLDAYEEFKEESSVDSLRILTSKYDELKQYMKENEIQEDTLLK